MHQQQLIQLGVNAVDDPQMDLGMVLMESRQLIDEMAGQQTGNAANPQNAFPAPRMSSISSRAFCSVFSIVSA